MHDFDGWVKERYDKTLERLRNEERATHWTSEVTELTLLVLSAATPVLVALQPLEPILKWPAVSTAGAVSLCTSLLRFFRLRDKRNYAFTFREGARSGAVSV